MAGRTPNDAVRAFVGPIQEALGCFADGRVTVDKHQADQEGVLTFNGGDQVPLFGDARVSLSVSMRYVIVETDDPTRGPYKVKTTGYMYEVQREDVTLIEYHWHPISKSHEVRPHMHCAQIGKAHLPTGRIMIEDVLNYAVEHGAKPRKSERWARLDADNRKKFALGATWGAGPTP